MSHALSNDLRRRLVVAVENGMSRRSAAKRFGVSPSTAIRWVHQWFREGHVEPARQGGDNRSGRMETHADEVLALIDATPDITLTELAEYLEKTHGLRVSQSTVWRLLDRHGMTFKKNGTRKRATAS
jgi:transposase